MERVVIEKDELNERINKLSAFVDGDDYQSLPFAEKARLVNQLRVMKLYSYILGERIQAHGH